MHRPTANGVCAGLRPLLPFDDHWGCDSHHRGSNSIFRQSEFKALHFSESHRGTVCSYGQTMYGSGDRTSEPFGKITVLKRELRIHYTENLGLTFGSLAAVSDAE